MSVRINFIFLFRKTGSRYILCRRGYFRPEGADRPGWGSRARCRAGSGGSRTWKWRKGREALKRRGGRGKFSSGVVQFRNCLLEFFFSKDTKIEGFPFHPGPVFGGNVNEAIKERGERGWRPRKMTQSMPGTSDGLKTFLLSLGDLFYPGGSSNLLTFLVSDGPRGIFLSSGHQPSHTEGRKEGAGNRNSHRPQRHLQIGRRRRRTLTMMTKTRKEGGDNNGGSMEEKKLLFLGDCPPSPYQS